MTNDIHFISDNIYVFHKGSAKISVPPQPLFKLPQFMKHLDDTYMSSGGRLSVILP